MPVSPLPLLAFLRVAATADTVVARVLPVRGVLEWTSAVLDLVVLILGAGLLIGLLLLVLSIRRLLQRTIQFVDQVDTRLQPILERANDIANDARAMSTTVRGDLERFSAAAGAVGARIHHAADTTVQRLEDLNALVEELQAELGGAVRMLLAFLRGLRRGASALGRRRRRDTDDGSRDR